MDPLLNGTVNTTSLISTNSTQVVSNGMTNTFYISLFLIYIPGIMTNTVSLILIPIEARHTTIPTNFLLFVLCFTDLVAVCTTCLWHNLGRYGIVDTYEICAVKVFMQTFCPIFSGLVSVFMALDRAMAFYAPFFYRSNITKKVWSIVCFWGCVCISSLCILPHLGLGSMLNAVHKGDTVKYKCSAFQFPKEPRQRTFLILFSLTGIILVSLIIICNFIVVVTVLKLRQRNIDVKKKSGSTMSTKALELRFAVIVIILACVFITCWTPYNIWVMYTLLGVYMSPTTIGRIHMLAGFNFSIDPFVYLIIRKSNRQVLRRLFKCFRCCSKKKMLDFTTVKSTKQVGIASERNLTTEM